MPINRMKGIHTPSRSLLLLSIQVMERPANGFNCLWRVDSAFSTSHVWFCLSAHLRVCSSGRLFPYLSAYLPVCLSTGLPVYVSTYIQLHIDLHIFKYMFYFAVCLSDCLITNLYTFNKEMELTIAHTRWLLNLYLSWYVSSKNIQTMLHYYLLSTSYLELCSFL